MTIVTKITASYNKEDDIAMLYLYSGKTMVLKLDGYEIGLKTFTSMNAKNKNIYLQYAKEYMINLITNGGLDDGNVVYNEELELDVIGRSQSVIFENNKKFTEYFTNKIVEILDELGYKDIQVNMSMINTTKRSKSGNNILFADAKARVTIGKHEIVIPVEVKSGQPCKPKHFLYNDKEYTLNKTNVKKLEE